MLKQRVTIDFNERTVIVDDVDLSPVVSGVTIRCGAGHLPEVELSMFAVEGQVSGDALVSAKVEELVDMTDDRSGD